MHRGFTGSYDQPLQTNHDIEIVNDILYGELENLYKDSMQGMRSCKVMLLAKKDDPDTLHVLNAGTLPMPINRKLPLAVVYYKVCFEADQTKEIELLIGEFNRPPKFCSLGIHNGHKWTRAPLQIFQGMNRAT